MTRTTSTPRMHTPMRPHALLLAALLLGCSDPERLPRAAGDEDDSDDSASSSDTGAPVEVDLETVRAMATAYADLAPLTEVHELAETHADAAAVRVWGTPDAEDPFAAIDPNDPTVAAAFPVETMLVKEHFDADGGMFGLNVMYKAPPGYNPAANDWYWLEVRDDVVTHSGRVTFCMDCHEAAINSDFVVGFGKSQ